MRFVLTAVMALLLAVVTTTDRIACIDGCTGEAQHETGATTAPSVCGLCHGWNGPPAASIGAPAPHPVAPSAPAASRERPAHVAPPEHPPKLH